MPGDLFPALLFPTLAKRRSWTFIGMAVMALQKAIKPELMPEIFANI